MLICQLCCCLYIFIFGGFIVNLIHGFDIGSSPNYVRVLVGIWGFAMIIKYLPDSRNSFGKTVLDIASVMAGAGLILLAC